MAQNRSERVLDSVTQLAQEMLNLHGIDNLAEFVLHSLCHESCYNLSKAAYFINNHDFDCLKGIAGYRQEEAYGSTEEVCCDPSKFQEHMKTCAFNEKVRTVLIDKVSVVDFHHLFDTLSQSLGLTRPLVIKWNVKYDNEGILLFELPSSPELHHDAPPAEAKKTYGGLCLLGFCPIY